MSFIRGGETVTIKRRTEASVNEFGNPVYTTRNIVVRDVLIGIGTTSETIDQARDAVDATVTLYMPSDTVIEEGDRFIVRGSEWIKDGTAQVWVSPFPMEAGVVVPLRRRIG